MPDIGTLSLVVPLYTLVKYTLYLWIPTLILKEVNVEVFVKMWYAIKSRVEIERNYSYHDIPTFLELMPQEPPHTLFHHPIMYDSNSIAIENKARVLQQWNITSQQKKKTHWIKGTMSHWGNNFSLLGDHKVLEHRTPNIVHTCKKRC